MKNELENYIYADISCFECPKRRFYPIEVFLAKRDTIINHSYVKPHPDIILGDYLKKLSIDKCLKYAPRWEQVNFVLGELVRNEKIVIWNSAYEVKHFPSLKNASEILCLMKETTNYFGIQRGNNPFIKYSKLKEVAELLNIKFGIEGFSSRFNKPHRVVSDVKVLMDIHERYFYRHIRCPSLPPIINSMGERLW